MDNKYTTTINSLKKQYKYLLNKQNINGGSLYNLNHIINNYNNTNQNILLSELQESYLIDYNKNQNPYGIINNKKCTQYNQLFGILIPPNII